MSDPSNFVNYNKFQPTKKVYQKICSIKQKIIIFTNSITIIKRIVIKHAQNIHSNMKFLRKKNV